MASQNALMSIKGWGLLPFKERQVIFLAFWLRWLALGALMLTILLLGDWRPIRFGVVSDNSLLSPFDRRLVLYPSDAGALATTVLWLLSWGLSRVVGRTPTPAGYKSEVRPALQASPFAVKIVAPLAGLAGLAALSATQAAAPVLSLKIALHLVILLGLVLAVWNLRPPAWVIVAPLALLLAAQGVLALLQVWAQSSLIGRLLFHWTAEATPYQSGASVIQLADGSRWLRGYGTFPHPNILGGFLCLALPVIAGAALRLPWRSRVAWLLWGAFGLGSVALLLSFSRGAWLGVLGALGWAWLMRRRLARKISDGTDAQEQGQPDPQVGKLRGWLVQQRWTGKVLLALLALGFVGGLVVALGPMLQSRLLLNSVPLEQRSVDERVILLEASAFFISQHPWLGVGAGNMPLAERSYPPTSNIVQPAHNVPLAVAVETGLAGLLLWLIPPANLLWGVWRWKKEEGGAGWALTGCAALVAVLIAAQLDHYFWSQPIGRLMYWLTIGLAMLWCKANLARRGT
jgi:putative inorganic carbon (HCO3(-)) transporter